LTERPGAPLALVGMPGSGKSTVGRHLARQLGWKFVDSDHEIEHAIGGSIRVYFEQQGETAFRDLEEQTIARLCQQQARCWPRVAGPSCGRPTAMP
jgi:shikimate kinase